MFPALLKLPVKFKLELPAKSRVMVTPCGTVSEASSGDVGNAAEPPTAFPFAPMIRDCEPVEITCSRANAWAGVSAVPPVTVNVCAPLWMNCVPIDAGTKNVLCVDARFSALGSGIPEARAATGRGRRRNKEKTRLRCRPQNVRQSSPAAGASCRFPPRKFNLDSNSFRSAGKSPYRAILRSGKLSINAFAPQRTRREQPVIVTRHRRTQETVVTNCDPFLQQPEQTD